MIRKLPFILLLVLLASCATKPEDPFAEMDAASQKTFDAYSKLAKHDHPTSVILHEGLPHQMWDAELLESERNTKETIEIEGYPFYSEPKTIEGKEAEEILEILLNPELFVPYGGMKLCGGYHPDYDITTMLGSEDFHIQVCFGCHEVKLIGESQTITIDMKKGTIDQIRPLLLAHHDQRPESDFFRAQNNE